MNVASVIAVRLAQDAGDGRAQIEAALALGASPRQCTASVIRRSVRLATVPVMDNAKTMATVFLPGEMTVMVLAGADPLQVVFLQVLAVFMLPVAASLTATIVSPLAPAACSRRSSCGGGLGGRAGRAAGGLLQPQAGDRRRKRRGRGAPWPPALVRMSR
jgi:ABC-type iron transport system FetAB permease component